MATLNSEFQYLGRSDKLSPQSGSYGYYILLYGKTQADVKTGIHTVTIREVMACTANSSFYNFSSYYSGSVDGRSAFSGSKKPSSAWELGAFSAGGYSYKKGTVIAEGSVQVDATSGAARNAALSCMWQMNANSSAEYVPAKGATASVTAVAELPAIPRASAVLATDAFIESASVITINKASPAFLHTISYKMAGQSGFTAIVEKTSQEQYSWTVPASAYELIPNAREIEITIRCETFNGASSLGTNETKMVASTRESLCAPAVTVKSCEDVNSKTKALTGNPKKIVRGVSNIRVVSNGKAKNGATIKSIQVVAGGKSATGNDVTLEAVETASVVAKITDSRNYSTSINVDGLTLVEYVPLTINPDVSRPSPSSDTVTVNVTGNCFSGSFGAVNNSLAVNVRYRPLGGTYGEDNPLTVTRGVDTYSATITLPNIDYSEIYELLFTATDSVGTKDTTETVKRGIPVYHWGKDNFRVRVPATIDSEKPRSVVGSATKDGAIDNEIQTYASEMPDGVFKYTYIPATEHSTLGGSPMLVECFKESYGNGYSAAYRVTPLTQTASPSYSATYDSNSGFSGWSTAGTGGTPGPQGPAGLPALVANSGFSTRYPVGGNYANGTLSMFNRTPVSGETVQIICAGRYLTIFEVGSVLGQSIALKPIHEYDLKGEKGDPGSNATVTVDSALSSTSTNPVQNKVVNAALDGKLSKSGGTLSGDLVAKKTDSTAVGISVQNSNGAVTLNAATNRGLWDSTGGKWMVYADANNNVTLNGNATTATTATTSTKLQGVYTGGTTTGGAEPPSYVGASSLKCNMMNRFVGTDVTSFYSYADVLLMNGYGWWDVPYATALAIQKTDGIPRAWIAAGGNTDVWSGATEIITKNNVGSQSVSSATNSNKLVPSSTTRPTSANLSATGDRSVQHLLATSSMSTGKPADDGHILHMEWDSKDGWSSQVFVPHGKDYHMQYRMMHSGTWQPWRTLLDSASTVQMSQGGTGGTSGQTGLQNLLAAGVMILSAHQYGTSLPSAGTPGRIFFKKAGS